MLSPRITEMMTERYPNSSTEFDVLCARPLVECEPECEPHGHSWSRSPTPDGRYRSAEIQAGVRAGLALLSATAQSDLIIVLLVAALVLNAELQNQALGTSASAT